MVAQTPIRFLYLGHQPGLAQEIEIVWANMRAAESTPSYPPLRIIWVVNQRQALDALRGLPVHTLLLDVNNYGSLRTRLCQDLRRRYPELRIVAVCQEPLKPKRLEFDGVLKLPVRAKEAETLLHAVYQSENTTRLRVGPIQLDVATRILQGPRGRHQLPPKQCDLLRVLMHHAGEVVSRETIMRTVWETEYMADTRTLDVHMRWLREKVEPEPSHPVHLLTVRGQGYRLMAR